MTYISWNVFTGRVWALACAGLIAAGIGRAGVFHDEKAGMLVVTDFPAEMPCTLERLCQLDARLGWGKVAYDRATDTYTVSCGLRIGANDGTETYFQIGDKLHPRETLILKGNLVVYPYGIDGENRDITWKDGYGRIRPNEARKRVNRLTMGDPKDASVKPVLKFDCAKPGQFGLSVGRADAYGGQCHVHNALITAAAQKWENTIKIAWGGDSVILDGATISWVDGNIGSGLPEAGCRITNCIFEYAAGATYNGSVRMTGCTLRNLESAVSDAGGLSAVLTDCVFENNARNYSLPNTAWGLTCIDCTLGKTQQPDILTATKRPGGNAARYPYFISQRHIVVEVTDASGAPLMNAQVAVTCEQGILEAVAHGKQATDAAGRTPGKGGQSPILLTEVLKKATDMPDKPAIQAYTFAIEASAEGHGTNIVQGFVPARSWEVVRISLGN